MPDKSNLSLPFKILKNSTRYELRVQEVIHLKADINYTSLFTATGNYIVAKTLKEMEEILDPGLFIRTHKSHIINKNQVVRVKVCGEERKVILKCGAEIEIARRRLKEVIRSINPY